MVIQYNMNTKRFTAAQSQNNTILIFDNGTQIGSYFRNYHSFGDSTFYAFEQNGKWYALYSRDYTCTRIMSLPDCVDIGGEVPENEGFCPVELYVPQICFQKLSQADPRPYNPRHDPERWATKVPHDGYVEYRWDQSQEFKDTCKKFDAEFDEWMNKYPYVTEYAPWGFVAGCHWGDDSSWKIQFIDLSKASDGIITRDDRFGYIELPSGVSLESAIDTRGFKPERPFIEIALPTTFNINGTKHEES